MAVFQSLTRAAVRQSIGHLAYARQLFFVDPTVGVSSASSMVFNRAQRWPTNTLLGRGLYFGSGINAGRQRQVTSHDQSGTVQTIPFPNTPAIGDVGEFWPEDIQPESINANINTAIGRGSDVCNVYTEAVPTIDTTRLIVDIPATFVRLSGFGYYYQGIIYDYEPADWLDPAYAKYQIRGRKLYLSQAVSASATDLVIRGYRLPALPTADTDLIEMNPEFVKLMAAALTEAGDSASPGYDPEGSAPRSQVWFREAMDIRANMITAWVPNTRELA